jgi:hypothetical protein
MLGLFLVYTPDSLIIFNPFRIMNRGATKPIVLDAYITTKPPKFNPSESNDPKNKNDIITIDKLKTLLNALSIDNTENITNKIRILIDVLWDTDIGNENCPFDKNQEVKELFGGLNIKELTSVYPIVSTSIIWIAYLFETDKHINKLSDAELGKRIKYILVNVGDGIIYRDSNLNKPEDIIFGDIQF